MLLGKTWCPLLGKPDPPGLIPVAGMFLLPSLAPGLTPDSMQVITFGSITSVLVNL